MNLNQRLSVVALLSLVNLGGNIYWFTKAPETHVEFETVKTNYLTVNGKNGLVLIDAAYCPRIMAIDTSNSGSCHDESSFRDGINRSTDNLFEEVK